MKNADAQPGVYYRRGDYAGFWRRLMVDLVDIAIAGTLIFALYSALWTAIPAIQDAAALFMGVAMPIAFAYFVVLKRSKWRTPGYRLGRVRIVGMDGQAASWGALTYRLSFASLGPFNWLLDIVWLSNDPHRQALRDKYAGTYVIAANALPAGVGVQVYRCYLIMGYNFMFREVAIPQAPGASAAVA